MCRKNDYRKFQESLMQIEVRWLQTSLEKIAYVSDVIFSL